MEWRMDGELCGCKDCRRSRRSTRSINSRLVVAKKRKQGSINDAHVDLHAVHVHACLRAFLISSKSRQVDRNSVVRSFAIARPAVCPSVAAHCILDADVRCRLSKSLSVKPEQLQYRQSVSPVSISK